ncbi:MAG: ATP-binding protein [Anaerolineae bacterium]|jgi:lon-related putative ATP-dependent protease
MSEQTRELVVEEIWNPCDPALFAFETTASLPGEVSIIGQDRAVQAIEFGVNVRAAGFNIFALGEPGTGRTTTINTLLDGVADGRPVPDDWLYVNNFRDENRPRAIALPAGTAIRLRREIETLVTDLLREIPRAFDNGSYRQQREAIGRQAQEEHDETLDNLERIVNDQGFTLLRSDAGLGIAPVLNGQVLAPEDYEQLDRATQQQIEARQALLESEIRETIHAIRSQERAARDRLRSFDRQVAESVVARSIQDLKDSFGDHPQIVDYLEEMQADVVARADRFEEPEEREGKRTAAVQAGRRTELLGRYQVNVVVDHSRQQGAPVIFEPNPTYSNLVGRIEHRAEMGTLVTDVSMIRAGALHRANGGYLVVEADGLLADSTAWEGLKRALKNRCIRIEEANKQMQVVSTVTLEPEPIPLEVKVLLIGDPETYYGLYEYDLDFGKLFKVQADFGAEFQRAEGAIHCYAQFVAARCHKEALPHFDREAVARVVEHGSRLAEHKQKLSTRFGEIADLVREAGYWAGHGGRECTTAADVEKAVAQRIYRANRIEQEIQEEIDEGVLRVDVSGEALGQVNGLSILSLGNYQFAKPSRITSRTYTGKDGIVSLNREAKLSGRIYDKGLLTINGYLGGQYALDVPLNLSASIAFEQLYNEIEGDSASSAELYALLSSLSELPIRQGIAVTGSVDQQGNIQPVGGVNEKIEGFFDTCQHRGLTGQQGVIVPVQNVVNLMLRADVRQAVAEGLFHIYAVGTIDEGLEILTGVPAGEIDENGNYPEETIHGRVQDRLLEIGENLREADGEGEEEEDGSIFASLDDGDGGNGA